MGCIRRRQWANIEKSTNGGTRFSSATLGLDAVRSDVLGPEANYLFIAPGRKRLFAFTHGRGVRRVDVR